MPQEPADPEAPQEKEPSRSAPAHRKRQPSDDEQPLVVGIGASAGGLKALRTFFSAIPAETDIVFVVVVHLSPDHESSLPELLQAAASLPVRQVTDTTRMAPGSVYVIPPGKHIEITNGHLTLVELEERRLQRAPIDHFFRTLAYTHPDSVGILLSGGGTDGTVGMRAIKEQGGLVMAQAPEEAEYDDMPRSAIATGEVDFILPVEKLAQKLLELRENLDLYWLPTEPETLPATDRTALKKILEQLRSQTGHDFSGYKRSTVMRRLQRRMRVNQVENLSTYFGLLRDNAQEAEDLFEDLLISVTSFFRDPEAWEALQEEVIPKLFEDKTDEDDLRVWVPGCATGEEAYSLAMLLLEHASTLEEPPHSQLFACDLDENALASAREGTYPEVIAADVSEERLARFFIKHGQYYRVKKQVRDLILFASHNLLKDPPFSKLDLISCRNLLIYLQQDLQEKVLQAFHYALRPNGYLFLGSSESAGGEKQLFRPVQKKHRIYRQNRTAREPARLPDLPLTLAPRRRRIASAASPPRLRPEASAGELHRQSLEEHAPPSVLVDENHNILHLSQNAGRYLVYSAGRPSHNILKAIRNEMRLVLRSMLRRVFEENKATANGPIEVSIEGERRWVHLIVRPAGDEEHDERLALVVLAESDPSSEEPAPRGALDSDARVQQLGEELERTREQLQSTIEEHETSEEELKAANEELQSMNEEYKSTLEELETSQEELQSVNEELHTVNAELNNKVEALTHANDDLKNLMASTDVATVFLDRQLQIQRFTPQAKRLFNIMERDLGRPLAHVTHKLVGFDDMVSEAKQVLRTLVPTEHEVEDGDDRWYLVRMLPYRTTEDLIRGVVITFVEITRLKQAQEQMRRTAERHRLFLEQVKEYAIFTMDEEGRVSSWNPGAERIFGYEEDEVLGQPVMIIFTSEDQDEDAALKEMEVAAREGEASDERWHVRKDGSRFWASGIVTALHDEEGALRGYAKVLRDNTQRRETIEALRESRQQLQVLNETLEERVEKRTKALEEKSEQVHHLASELVIAEQRERHRIAQVLHDDLQQQLYGVQMRMAMINREAEAQDVPSLKGKIENTNELLNQAIEKTRNLSVSLSPPVLKDEGLTEALGWLASQMEELHDLQVKIDAAEAFRFRDREMHVLLFQAARELLFNVIKHAGTECAHVELQKADDRLRMSVTDEGDGFDPDEVFQEDKGRSHFGLRNVRERLRLFGGDMDIVSTPGEGTQVTITVPVAWDPS